MRRYFFTGAIVLLFSSLGYVGMMHHTAEEKARVKPGGGVAVLELFTSEGCSSCPAADRLLSEVYDTYHDKDLPVYPLAFHVDYWNYLGWRDEFSDPAFTKRQYAYGEKFRLSSIYTPQLVVNGKTEFVGSSRSRVIESISNALSAGSEVAVDVDVTQKDRMLDVVVSLDKVPAESIVLLAVAERDLKREIKRGENSGLTLTHDNVVRVFQMAPAASEIRKTLTLPLDLKKANSSVVAFVQNKNSLAIVGAAAKDLLLP